MVLDNNTVIFQKEKGGGGVHTICIKITGMQDSNQGRQKEKCDIEYMSLR